MIPVTKFEIFKLVSSGVTIIALLLVSISVMTNEPELSNAELVLANFIYVPT